MSNSQSNSQEKTVAELYAEGYANPKATNYAQASRVLQHLTYQTIETHKKSPNFGKLVRKRLSTKARILFIDILDTQGSEGNLCWKTERTFSSNLGISKGSISSAKKELMMNFEQLDNQPLIKIEVRRKSVRKKKRGEETISRGYSVDQHYTSVNENFWRLSNGYMNSIKFQPKLVKGLIDVHNSVHEEGTRPTFGHVDIGRAQPLTQVDIGRAQPLTHNKNPSPKNPSSLEQEPTGAGASRCSYSSKEELGSFTDTGSYGLMMQCTEWLRKNNVDDKLVSMILAHDERDIAQAIEYTVKMHKNGQKKREKGVDSVGPYLLRVVENRWFLGSRK